MGGRASSLTLIGRETELTGLKELLTEAERGSPRIALLAGEAGIGKSRLADELEQLASDRGYAVLRGDCIESAGVELAYAPVVAALRDVRTLTDDQMLADLGEVAVGELARLLPGLGVARPATGDPGAFAQARLFELLVQLLGRISARRPVLFVLEDLHWGDESTRTFFDFLVRTVRDERVLAVTTYRTDDLHHSYPLRKTIAELGRLPGVETFQLTPLAREDVSAQLETILGEPPPRRLVADIFKRSGGNPFFAEELLAASRSGGTGLPGSLRDTLLLRLEGLAPSTLAVLRALAVVGRPAVPALLVRGAGTPASETRAGIRAALDRHLVIADRSAGTVAFRHALMREAVYADLLPDEREMFHGAFAEALAEQPHPPMAELAHHAHAGAQHGLALRASIEAGLAAERLYAYEEASVHFERAVTCWQAADPAGLALDLVDLLSHAAEAQRYRGDYARAIGLCRRAVGAVDRDSEPQRAAELLERLGQFHYADDEVPLACFDEALSLLAEEPASRARARVLAARGMALLGMSRYDEARIACEQSLAIALRCDASSEEAAARANLGLALSFLGEPQAADVHLDRARSLVDTGGRVEDRARLQLYRAEVLRMRGDTAAALELMVEGTRMAGRIGVAGSFGRYMAVHATEDLRTLGRWSEARGRLSALDSEELGTTARLMRAVVAARLAVARGDDEAGGAELELARRLAADGAPAEALPGVHAAAAERALWALDPEQAVNEVESGLKAIGLRHDALNTPVLHALGARAHADLAVLASDEVAVNRAIAGADSMLKRLETLVEALAPPPPTATAYLLLTRAERARANTTDDAARWRAAANAWDRLGHAYDACYARWRLAEALVHAGVRQGGELELRVAARSADTLGAGPLRAEIHALARRARIDLSAEALPVQAADGVRPGTDDLGLTARELDVLALVAEGLTNRQIAAKLFMAPATAGVHVSRILSKLGARNRVEAAGIAHRHGLGPQPTTTKR